MWILTAVPPKRPTVMDQGILFSVCGAILAPMSKVRPGGGCRTPARPGGGKREGGEKGKEERGHMPKAMQCIAAAKTIRTGGRTMARSTEKRELWMMGP